MDEQNLPFESAVQDGKQAAVVQQVAYLEKDVRRQCGVRDHSGTILLPESMSFVYGHPGQ